MLFFLQGIMQTQPEYVLQYAVGFFLAALVGMTVHEFAHNYVAFLMGDPTPADSGRLTLNPAVHIYMPGFLMFVVIGFGILGTAPINPYRMRNPRWGYLAAVAAGPLSNLLLAVVTALIMHLAGLQHGFQFQLSPIAFNLHIILSMMVLFNVLMFIFNLLPLYPIDGWRIVYTLLPPDLAESWDRNKIYTQYAFFILLMFSFVRLPGIPNLLDIIISQPLWGIILDVLKIIPSLLVS